MLQLAAEAANAPSKRRLSSKTARPKVEAYDAFIDADGTYTIGAAAKMVGLSQNKLFDRLRNDGVLIAQRVRCEYMWYQQYMHHFAVKAYDYERSNGDRGHVVHDEGSALRC